MYLIPDEILELMTCDNCHKFLSVGQVQVYPNNQTKCGRCVEYEDEGAISQYDSLVEHALFKCVNRFDGCRQLLAYDEVYQHEDTCKSKAHVCPICLGDTSIPTYLMIKHFKEKHPFRLLNKPCFQVDVNSTKESFLYRNKDDLFIVEYECSEKLFHLDVYFLGENQGADKIKFKSFVHSEMTYKTEIRVRKCIAYGSLKSSGVSPMEPLTKGDFVFVEFELCQQVMAEFTDYPMRKTETEIISDILERVHMRSKKINDMKEWKLFLMKKNREVSLSMLFQRTHPDFQVDGSFTLSRTVEQKKMIIIPFCHNCSCPTPLRQNYLRVRPSCYQVLCWLCEKYYETQKVGLKFLRKEELFQFPMDYSVLYSCLWKCKGYFPWHQIFNHEVYCQHQQDQQCPVPFCIYTGKLDSFLKHFENNHTSYEISLYPRVVVGRPSMPCSTMIYLWVSRAFVSLNFRWDGEQYNIAVGENACGWVRPRAMIFIDDWSNCLAVSTNDQAFTWKNEEFLYIKCYLARNNESVYVAGTDIFGKNLFPKVFQ